MTRNRAITRLIEAERREDLWSRRVLGMPVWPLERLHHYRAELLAEADAEDDPRTNPPGNLAPRALASLRDFARGGPASRPGRDFWVLSASNYRRKDDGGVYQCAFAEHLRAELGNRLLFIERNHAALPAQDRDDVLFIDAALFGAEAAGRAAGPLLAHTPLGAATRSRGTPARASLLCRDAVYGRVLHALARRWIRRCRPRAVFVLNAYHLFIPFQIAAHEAAIPVIELQHGIIHESHPGYVWGGVPSLAHFPDHLVVFGRHFGELLDRENPFWRGKWSVGGQPWLKEKRRGLENLPEQAFSDVVVFSQPNAPIREQLRRLLPELRAALPPKLRLVLKPHPRELDAAAFYGGATRGIELATPRDDTYDLLRRARLAVSVASTVGIEALAFRCRSAVLTSSSRLADLQALVDQGVLASADSARELAALAALGPARESDEDLANRLFGVRETVPSFEGLVREIAARRQSGGRIEG